MRFITIDIAIKPNPIKISINGLPFKKKTGEIILAMIKTQNNVGKNQRCLIPDSNSQIEKSLGITI